MPESLPRDMPPTAGRNGKPTDRPARAAPIPELAAYSDDDLAALLAAAERERDARHDRKCEAFYATMREQAGLLGLDTDAVVAALGGKRKRAGTDRRSTVAPKWRNPDSPCQTWAGRGKPPPWVEMGPDGKTPLPKFAIGE